VPDILVAAADLDRLERSAGMAPGSITREDHQVVAALERAGASAGVAHWDDPAIAWHDADAVLVRSAWDYPSRRDEFVAWAGEVGAGTRLFPDADVVRWNTHKSYLLELEDRGAPIVPTAWLGAGDVVSLADLARDRGWSQVVAKPAVDLAGLHLLVAEDPVAAQDDFAALVADHDVLVQPLLRRIRSDGEVSVVCIDGRVSHALHKQPAPDSWRVHEEHGGRFEVVRLDRSRATLAEWVVAATGVEPLVARVDLVPADDGAWQVGEVELVEPALYLGWVPEAADRLAVALLGRLAAGDATPPGVAGH